MKNFRQQHRPKKSSLIIGRNAVKEAIGSGKQLDRIYLQNNLQGKWIEEIRSLAQQHQIPINKVPVEKLNGFNISDHGGVVAQIARIQYHDLQQIISFVVEKGETPLFMLLDGITDIRNIGGIARTAYCCGVHALIIPDKGVGALNE
ncbi:MAG: 23S rRNA (guanosine(2251)-2'-O)-methyltransferase RlmB, partial [Bacteroidetes bacterium]